MSWLRGLVVCGALASGCDFTSRPQFPADDPNGRGAVDAAAAADVPAWMPPPPSDATSPAFDSPPVPAFDAAENHDDVASFADAPARADAPPRDTGRPVTDDAGPSADAPDAGDVPDASRDAGADATPDATAGDVPGDVEVLADI